MFFRQHIVTCVYPNSDIFIPLLIFLVGILFVYAVLITLMLLICRKNLVRIERLRLELDDANTKNNMVLRNIANERALNDTRVVRVMGSIVDVLKN